MSKTIINPHELQYVSCHLAKPVKFENLWSKLFKQLQVNDHWHNQWNYVLSNQRLLQPYKQQKLQLLDIATRRSQLFSYLIANAQVKCQLNRDGLIKCTRLVEIISYILSATANRQSPFKSLTPAIVVKSNRPTNQTNN